MTAHLKKGERVQLPGDSTSRDARARRRANPATGATYDQASKSVRFKVGKELKEAVNKGKK